MKSAFKTVILISGRGSNMQSLHEQASAYEVVSVISDNPNATGLQYAKQHGINTLAFERARFSSKSEMRQALFSAVLETSADLVALAGFMQIVDADTVQRLWGRLINIHPALLPAYPGLHTHERALADGAKYHGCSVHYVDSGMDTGPVIAQAKVPVLAADTVETLAERVLHREHQIYPWVVQKIALGEIKLHQGEVVYSSAAILEAGQRDFVLPGARK